MHLDRESALTAAEPLPASAATILELDQEPAAVTHSLGRDSIVFGLGTLAGKIVGFLVVPVFARLLEPEGFGRLDVLNTLVSSALLIVMLGTDVAAMRLYFDRPTPEAARRLLSTWCLVAVGAAAIPALVLLVGAAPISRTIFGSEELAPAVALVAVALMAGIVQFVALGVLRATRRSAAYALLEGGALAVNSVLAVTLLTVWRADPTAVMLALAVSWSTAAVVGVALVRRWVLAPPSLSAAREILALALPLAPAIVATWGADFFHRAYLLGVAGATEAGYLSMATRLGSVAMLVVAAAQLAWHPHAYRLGTSDEAASQLAIEGRQIVVALVACVGVLGLLAPEALTLIGGSAYVAAAPAVGAFLVSVLAVGLFSLASLASAIQRHTGDLGWAVVVGVGAAVIANLVLAPRVGALGTGVAIAIGQSMSALIAVLLGRRRMPIPFTWHRILALVGLTAGLILAATVLPTLPMVVRLLLVAGLGVVLVAEGTLPTWLGTIGRGSRRPAGT